MPPLEEPGADDADALAFGLYHRREYVVTTWLHYRKFGTFPNGLSYDAQSLLLLQDYEALDKRYGVINDALALDENWTPPTFEPFVVPGCEATAPAPRGLFERKSQD